MHALDGRVLEEVGGGDVTPTEYAICAAWARGRSAWMGYCLWVMDAT